MRFRAFKYLSPLSMYLMAWLAFNGHGLLCFLPVIYALVFIPLVELALPVDARNMAAAEEEIARRDKLYDYLLYLFVILQFVSLFFFLQSMKESDLPLADRLGRIYTMGLLCGIFGINIGHELGHRVAFTDRLLAKLSLMTSLYMHFFIEHNKGHHKHVGTPGDPASARLGESIYRFWPRTIFKSYLSAWNIANREKPVGFRNEMVQFHLIQIAFVAVILIVFGWLPLFCFLNAALIGILLLELVNYIEHYGLRRKEIVPGKYERVMPVHSWNSSHPFGRIMLFELSRHSDHHYMASRKFQLLRHAGDAPQMPTGYPGMMLLSLLPPAWFYIMHKRLREFSL